MDFVKWLCLSPAIRHRIAAIGILVGPQQIVFHLLRILNRFPANGQGFKIPNLPDCPAAAVVFPQSIAIANILPESLSQAPSPLCLPNIEASAVARFPFLLQFSHRICRNARFRSIRNKAKLPIGCFHEIQPILPGNRRAPCRRDEALAMRRLSRRHRPSLHRSCALLHLFAPSEGVFLSRRDLAFAMFLWYH